MIMAWHGIPSISIEFRSIGLDVSLVLGLIALRVALLFLLSFPRELTDPPLFTFVCRWGHRGRSSELGAWLGQVLPPPSCGRERLETERGL